MQPTISSKVATPIDSWYVENCRCPIDKQKFTFADSELTCASGHRYPVLRGIPILLNFQDLPVFLQGKNLDALIQEGLSVPEPSQSVDPYVQEAVAGSNGIMYRSLVGKLAEYPLPGLPLDSGKGKRFLDIGCNWGRWSLAAARLGYEVVGIDPNPRGIFGAHRVARQLGFYNRYVVADARYLPFAPECFDLVFSYSVFQHFPKEDVHQTLVEIERVLAQDGMCKIQMANRNGLRSLVHQMRRGFKEATHFDVRYWAPGELKQNWERLVGKSTISVDGFFSLNPQTTEAHLLPWYFQLVVRLSNVLKRVSRHVPGFFWFADSLYIQASKKKRAA